MNLCGRKWEQWFGDTLVNQHGKSGLHAGHTSSNGPCFAMLVYRSVTLQEIAVLQFQPWPLYDCQHMNYSGLRSLRPDHSAGSAGKKTIEVQRGKLVAAFDLEFFLRPRRGCGRGGGCCNLPGWSEKVGEQGPQGPMVANGECNADKEVSWES